MPREETLIDTCYFDAEVDINFQDAKKVWSVLWHREKLIYKKRRWLARWATISKSEGNWKKSKIPKFLTNMLLPESYVRSDEVSFETLRANVEKSFESLSQSRHHVVQDYLRFFDKQKMEIYSVNLVQFLRTFFSIMDDLNNRSLLFVASIVTDNKVSFERTRPKMKKIIKDYLPEALAESSCKDRMKLFQQLSKVFRKPSNFREKQLTLLTPISVSLLTSIHNVLEKIGEIPTQALVAVNRKLRGVEGAPQFPPVISGFKRELLLERVQKRCDKMIMALKEGNNLPKPLGKALSVMLLSLKQETKCMDIPGSEFYPFSPETVDLQNNILRALWALPKVKTVELKDLQPLIDPTGKISWKTFRTALRKYLMDYLFYCDEISLPEEALKILAAINRRSRRQACMVSKKMKEEEVEDVLNVSSQFKQLISDLVPELDIGNASAEDCSGELESDDGIETNDFILSGNEYCSNFFELKHQNICDSMFNDEVEATGESMPFDSFIHIANAESPPPIMDAPIDINKNQANLGHDSVIIELHASSESVGVHHQSTCEGIQAICDEASLLSHKIIGHLLDRIIQVEGRDTDTISKSYLRGEAPPSLDQQDAEGSSETSKEDTRLLLLQIVNELLPHFPKSSTERVKRLMRLP